MDGDSMYIFITPHSSAIDVQFYVSAAAAAAARLKETEQKGKEAE